MRQVALQRYDPTPAIPSGTRKVEPISQADYEQIKGRLPEYKYLLLTKVLRNTGLRETEVMQRTAEYFLQDGPLYSVYTYRRKKKGEPVWEKVAVHPELGMELKAYIDGNGIRAGSLVFSFTPRQYQRVFKAAALASIGRPAHPHLLRHLFTATLIDGGVPVGVASGLLGHENEETTLAHYYDLSWEKRAEIARRMPV